MPQHFLADRRPEFQAWLAARGLPAPAPPPAEISIRFSKWPKERKPQLAWAMRDAAVLRRAAEVTRQFIYDFGDDAKDYFNQLAMATCELHKLGIVFLSQPGDFEGAASSRFPLTFVSEKRLGFGTHGASNLAQRFSDLLLHLFQEDMDAAEAMEAPHLSVHELEWLQLRLGLQRRTGEPCVPIRRWTATPTEPLPDIPAPSRVADIPTGYVCPQLRMYSIYMFTDDAHATVVGVERTKRALRVWRRLTLDAGLIMAIPEKRSLGSCGKWLGVWLIVALGIVAVPRDKILRASVAVTEVLERGVPFHVYRSLCGLLEHLRAVNLQGRNVMHGLYRPHGPSGASRDGPNGWVQCDVLMTKQLQRWRQLLFRSCGVSVKRALLREEVESKPRIFIDLTSDACLADVEQAGLGGFCHGLYWTFVVPAEDRDLLTIPVLEFLAVCFNLLNFFSYLRTACESEAETRIVLRTDALSTALALPAETAKSELMIETFQALTATEQWQTLCYFIMVAHIFGDCNPAADLLSRQRMAEFLRLCGQLGIRPQQIPNAVTALELYASVVAAARRSTGPRVGGNNAPRRLQGPSAAFQVGGPLALAMRRRASFAGASQGADRARHSARPPSPALALRRGSSLPRQDPNGSAPPAEPVPPAHGEAHTPGPNLARAMRRGISSKPALTVPSPSARGGLLMPPPPASPRQASALVEASRIYAHRRMLGFTAGGDDMAFKANVPNLLALADSVGDATDMGINPNTARFDERAWAFWERVCKTHTTSPLRTEQDVREHPARNAHLLTCLALYAFSVCKPKSKSRHFIKPSSALAYPIAIIRIFARWAVVMPGFKAIKAAANGLSRQYLAYHGPLSLAPRRAENMTFVMVAAINAIPNRATVGGHEWDHTNHDVFIFRCLNLFMIFTAFRLGEIVGNGSTEIMFITWATLVWRIDGVMVAKPTAAQLRSMHTGRDSALVFPPRSKPDQFGVIHCPFPVTLTLENTALNAAAALRELELRIGTNITDRDATPLFGDASGRPYTHGFLHSMLRKALTFLYGSAVAKIFSWHSYRSGLATALHAANVEDSMIQLICRWMCPESLHVYRRKGTREHERLINLASTQNVDAVQSTNVVRVVGDEGYAGFFADLTRNATRRTFDQATDSAAQAPCPSAATVQPGRTATQTNAAPRKRPCVGAPPAQPRATLATLPATPKPGDSVVVPCELWPTYTCTELGGAGWAATIVKIIGSAAAVSFTNARTRDGRPYQDELLLLPQLKIAA